MHLVILMLLFAGLAWLISWGMVGILFYPKKPILGWQSPLVGWAKSVNMNTLLNKETLDHSLEKIMPIIDEKLDDFFRHRLTEKLPMISMFIGDKTIQQLKSVFMEELKQMFPTLMQSFASNMQKDLIDQLEHQSLQKFEIIAFKATAPLRKLAILIGLIWGVIAYSILNIF
ncbi:MAG: hypothetical protein ACO239_08155 [Sediminibacterium sp.]